MGEFPRCILSYEQLRTEATEFLAKYHPTGTIPIPIETIAEQGFGVDIVPVPGLQRILQDDDQGVVGFVTSDLREIRVDEWVWNHRYNRYRFTIAHELGHVVLHRELLLLRQYRSVGEWKAFINSIPVDEHRWYEWQAHAFAGLVLVPGAPLRQAFSVRVAEVLRAVKQEGVPLATVADTVWDITLDMVADDFEVSTEVVERRAVKDKLRPDFLPA